MYSEKNKKKSSVKAIALEKESSIVSETMRVF